MQQYGPDLRSIVNEKHVAKKEHSTILFLLYEAPEQEFNL